MGGGVTDPALACFSISPLRSAIAASSARSAATSSSSSGVINSVVGHCCQGIYEVDVGARHGFERHVRGGFGLGKGEGRGESWRVPFKHELAHLFIDELGDELLDQGEVVVDLFAGIRAVVEVSEAGVPSSYILLG
jgi:hypothetical protein